MKGKYKFPATFWVANIVELFERWAWYGMFAVFALYLTDSSESGALGFSQSQKGYLMGPLVAFLYFLPVITGAVADRFGYKKILLIAFAVLASGYFLLSQFTEYFSVYIVFMYLALGAALFKPVVSATIARTTNEKNASIGFGLFYMMVNIGAFIGPIFASKLRGSSWDYVFWLSAGISMLNFLLVLFFYKEPAREKRMVSAGKSIKEVWNNLGLIVRDYRFLIFLLIIVGFWAMYYQFFYSLPVFIEQWMDTTNLYQMLWSISPGIAGAIGTENGTVAPEMITNIDALYIVLFQLVISSVFMKVKPLNTMITGIVVSGLGMGLMFMFNNPVFLIFSILIFGLGEMASSPKITEYIGRIAPGDKVALYIGSSYLPVAGGNFLAGWLSGDVYQRMSDKISLAREEILARGGEWLENAGATKDELFSKAADYCGMTEQAFTNFLWDKYQPGNIWMVFAGIGLLSACFLFLYNKYIIRIKGSGVQ
jgi:dipeptide/tripeptide permease